MLYFIVLLISALAALLYQHIAYRKHLAKIRADRQVQLNKAWKTGFDSGWKSSSESPTNIAACYKAIFGSPKD